MTTSNTGSTSRVVEQARTPMSAEACRTHSEVAWTFTSDGEDRATLDRWCSTVGPPVVLASPSEPGTVKQLVVISWNVHVGGGRIEDLVGWLRADPVLGRQDAGIVLLLQEAFRSGSGIPFPVPPDATVPRAIRPGRPAPDVVASARALGMSVAYVPSMRNGDGDVDEREDRGNAVLSTEPLSDIRAIELPFGKQRRVVVLATVTPRGHATRPLRVGSMHFDTSRHRAAQSIAMAKQIRALSAERVPLIVSGDLNSLGGTRDAAFKSLAAALPAEPCGTRPTNIWPGRLDVVLGWWRGRIDFMFSSLDAFGRRRSCRTLPERFHSDHHPVLLHLNLD